MNPILFSANATEWKTQGLGALPDAISCKVTEERNGIFELEMQYPMTGLHFEDIADRCILLAIPSPYRSPQPFRIYRITRPMNGICNIYARHIAYDLAGIPLNPFEAKNAPAAMAALQSNAAIASPFEFWTDKSTEAKFSVPVPSSTRSVLGGQTGSVLDVYGGEYEWDNFTVKLWNQRGRDNGVNIRYGKNLTDIEQDRNIDNVYTGIYPYWTDSDGNLVVCDPKIVPAPGTYDFVRILPVDFSSDFEDRPTPEQLRERAESYVKDNKVGVPTVSIQASFVQLEQTEEYKDLALLEKCDLCDTVTIQFERLGVDAKAEIVKIETDVLLERYNSVEIGEVRANISDTIANQGDEIKDRPTNSELQNAVNSATNWITGTKGGYVIFQRNELGQPYEILIMDTPDIATAAKVWRWNNGGLGYSSTGYNGPYRTAITQDGSIVADFITTGTLNAALVKVVNLIANRVQSERENYMMEIWAAAMNLLEGKKLRTRIYTTKPVEGTKGIMQVFSGDVDADGTMHAGARVSQFQPSYIECGADKDGNCDGIVKTGTVVVEKVMPKNNNALAVDWVRDTINGVDYWVLASKA